MPSLRHLAYFVALGAVLGRFAGHVPLLGRGRRAGRATSSSIRASGWACPSAPDLARFAADQGRFGWNRRRHDLQPGLRLPDERALQPEPLLRPACADDRAGAGLLDFRRSSTSRWRHHGARPDDGAAGAGDRRGLRWPAASWWCRARGPFRARCPGGCWPLHQPLPLRRLQLVCRSGTGRAAAPPSPSALPNPSGRACWPCPSCWCCRRPGWWSSPASWRCGALWRRR